MITSVPWGHNVLITSKCETIEEATFYISAVIQNGWSRNVLRHQIEIQLYEREGKAISNFKKTLPKAQSDLAEQTLKDPYVFDFLAMSKNYSERDLENQLIEHITQFLLELGTGFAFIGRQVGLKVGNRDFFIDLLFYHTKLHCYIVLELKTGEFEPEHAGKLNFYIKAVDEQLKTDKDEPTIGLLLCKEKDKLIAEYSLSDIHKPMGISEYQLTQMLPNNLKSSLPSIEQIEKELSEED
jgi:predicted nuclease of restriction endonuclease-like (RecB) superfamily